MFERCRQLRILLNLKKCLFATPYGLLLGHIISKEGLMVDPIKITVLTNIPPLKIIKELRRFLGSTKYYRKFIENYASLAAPIDGLTKKN